MTKTIDFPVASQPLRLAGITVAAGGFKDEAGMTDSMLDALPACAAREINLATLADLGCAAGDASNNDAVSTACTGQLYWRDEECQAECDAAGPAASIALAYAKHGQAFLEEIRGEFSLVLCDHRSSTLLCAVDRFGRHPLFWTGDDAGLLVATTADALLAHPAVERRVSNQGLFDYLFFHMVPAPSSIYEGLSKLPAAHYLAWKKGSSPVTRPYWAPVFCEQEAESPELLAGVLDSLQEAVQRFDSGKGCGSFLSGGLDSSTVTGLLARNRPGADSYSIGFDAPGYDEIAYARLANTHFGTQGHEYYVNPEDIAQVIPRVAAAYDEPFGNSSALPALFCASLARADGKQVLLAGDGGDELYAGNERYAKQQVFENFQRLPTGVQSLLSAGSRLFPDGAPLVGKIRRYVAQARIPLPTRLQRYNFVYRLGLENMLSEDFAASINPDGPDHLSREVYQRPTQASTLNRMLYLDWQQTLADNDLRKVGRMCALAGIEVHYPMLDETVVEHSLRVPSHLKLPDGKLRHFYKRAVADFLPEGIINKSKHGFGLPFGVWLAENSKLRELAGDNLARLKRRRIVKPGFVDEILRLHQDSHAAYYGEFVWVLMMLELWLDSRGIEP